MLGGYVNLATRLFQGATVADLGRAAGAKSIAFPGVTEDWTLANGTANFLTADPNGCFIDSSGLKMQSGSSACSDDWGDGNILGPCLYKLVSEIVPAALWSSTSLGLLAMYSYIDLVWVIDSSSANANQEHIACGFGTTSAFNNGGSCKSGFTTAAAVGGSIQRGTYNNSNSLVSSITGLGTVTALRNRITPGGTDVAFGTASGLTPPSAWYSRDALGTMAADNTPNAAGSTLNKDMVAAIGLVDSNGGGAFTGCVKALYINAMRHVPGQSLAVAA